MVDSNRASKLKRYPIGSTRVHDTGKIKYILIKVSDRGRWKYIHRHLIEKKIGRKLLSYECVHHKDGDTFNNDINNLELLTNSEHIRKHNKNRVLSVKFTRKLPPGAWSTKYTKCVICNSNKSKHASKGRCLKCCGRIFRKNKTIVINQ